MVIDPAQLRALVNERLALLTDPRFALREPPQEVQFWTHTMENLAKLQDEKGPFFEAFGYRWALDRASYNSSFEALLQWRLLNALSDISSDHPAWGQCGNLIVRVLPTSCARPHLRKVEQYRVIILTSGYLSAFKGFIRLWLRGCALGETRTNHTPTNYRESALNYAAAIQQVEDRMEMSAKAYVGTLFQLLQNETPFMDAESIFDEEVLKRERWGYPFGVFGTAIDGFLLFHEAAHVLAGDSPKTERTAEAEIEADRGSVSLCIIDEARGGGQGTVHLGGPMFFCVELLRLLCEEILEVGAGRHDPSQKRYPGIEELMLRSRFYGVHIDRYLGPPIHHLYREWSDAIGLVFDTVRWALLSSVGEQVRLAEFVRLCESPQFVESDL